ncbi:hypothetical protein BDZ94DRAFT_1311743 [Collybia nuda]|uniref:FAD-binding PCMH-type domain-containing protein n=1 Tax=Collybia nuda TaxID=64659 RepID=A0A9P5Y0W1_9AGAR|nr:hypothetical protein BDZ94DRAFT_1311743 [Collybia nuda]
MVHLKCSLIIALVFIRLAASEPLLFEEQIYDSVCAQLALALPPNTVNNPTLDAVEYLKDITHWASSSTQRAKCSVRPGTPQEVASILRIVSSTRTPFAVKGGGHASNPGFSSTQGVHISMTRFSDVHYDPGSQTAVIGAGLIWDDVYAALAPYGVSVLGGRVTGIGVAGFTLGGGYSWKSNQHGLTIDSVVAFELVKPDGSIANITVTSDPTLFWGLKARTSGGLNNFGIVTRFTLKSQFSQGGIISYASAQISAVTDATVDFSTRVTDPKASIITTYSFSLGQPSITQALFYDAPTPPIGTFDKFLGIPHLIQDIGTREFVPFIRAFAANATYGQRGIFNAVSLTRCTSTILDAFLNETIFWGSRLSRKSGTIVSYVFEPLLPTVFSHNTTPSAYPPNRSRALFPIDIEYAWLDPDSDSDFHEAARQSAAHLRKVAIRETPEVAGASLYPNYAIFDTPLEDMYGDGVESLKSLKKEVDPADVMGLAGGFKF